MSLVAVLDLLRARTGLDPEALGPAAVAAAVAARMRALGLTDLTAYAAQAGGAEFDALVDEVVVPETWFFRGGAGLFAHLARHVAGVVAARPAEHPVRILSAPCSSGEEPYSLAIALTEAQVPAPRWTIDALDISQRSLERAARGRYGASAFRETEPRLRERYFRPGEGGWEVVPALRAAVRCRRGNLIEPAALAGEGRFDLVFCRNLLIYMHPTAREQVLAALDRLLTTDGLLCTGHAEPLSLLDRRFRPTGSPEFFLYERAGASSPLAPVGRGEGSGARGRFRFAKRKPDPLTPNSSPPQTGARGEEGPLPPQTGTRGEEARRLADAGRLDEALAVCRAHLATGPSPDLYSLLGVIHHARHERAEAAGCFRKALYLAPAHAEALTHLMLLCAEDGDSAAAALLRRRLERTAAGGDP
jgi:chemotaxis protein methyltransferase WspC